MKYAETPTYVVCDLALHVRYEGHALEPALEALACADEGGHLLVGCVPLRWNPDTYASHRRAVEKALEAGQHPVFGMQRCAPDMLLQPVVEPRALEASTPAPDTRPSSPMGGFAATTPMVYAAEHTADRHAFHGELRAFVAEHAGDEQAAAKALGLKGSTLKGWLRGAPSPLILERVRGRMAEVRAGRTVTEPFDVKLTQEIILPSNRTAERPEGDPELRRKLEPRALEALRALLRRCVAHHGSQAVVAARMEMAVNTLKRLLHKGVTVRWAAKVEPKLAALLEAPRSKGPVPPAHRRVRASPAELEVARAKVRRLHAHYGRMRRVAERVGVAETRLLYLLHNPVSRVMVEEQTPALDAALRALPSESNSGAAAQASG